ncbi:MAG: tetratricopeptide repeat protein [Gemmatimonadaceae bacterium]
MKAAPLVLACSMLASVGCFASKTEFIKLQDEVAASRATSTAADSAQAEQLASVSRSLRALTDSLLSLNRKVTAMRSTSETELAAMRQDISQLQDLSGQSEQRLREMRARLEEKRPEPAPVADDPAAGSSPSGPGPAQLLQAGRDQLLKGGNASARTAFDELVARYPNSEYAPEAIFYTAQSYAAERNPNAADSVYVVLIARFPNSPRVATAMYKRAQTMQAARRTPQARQMYQEIIRRFPRSDEAALAEERLQSLR